jgi:two-component system, chemotaxis family, protein-glutamate methylesterase/glutaminase
VTGVVAGKDRCGEPGASSLVAVLACSNGGMAALINVLGMLPAHPAFGLVIVKHVSPTVPTMLPSLLRTGSGMPVRAAADGDIPGPGEILVAPTGQHTLITAAGELALIPSGPIPPYRPSADLLLTTLAVSGRGRDGATGAIAVHHFGGTVIAASPDTSAEPGMPQGTIDADITDHIVPLDQIAGLLDTLAQQRLHIRPTIHPGSAP